MYQPDAPLRPEIPGDRWPEIFSLFEAARDLPEAQCATWLERLDSEQPDLAPTVRALLAAHARRESGDFLERGPLLGGGAGHAQPDPAAGLVPGAMVGPYRLLRPLGSGGMAVVWLARRSDGVLDREVALKLPQRLLLRPGLAERFSRERDILARLEHPHIARLYDAGLAPEDGPGAGLPYLAMEYVQGQGLTEYCDARGLGTPARLALVQQVAQAVQYAHTRLVIHRDLKPANILVTGEGQVRLLDFGVAKLLAGDDTGALTADTQLTQIAGQAYTPDYASPEQVRGEALGTASDVYSLGVVLYELLCGQRPYRLRHSSMAQLEQAITEAEPAPPSSRIDEAAAGRRGTPLKKLQAELRGELDTIVLKALKKRPQDRYATAAELAEDLRRHEQGQAVLARPDTLGYRLGKAVRRHKLAVGSAAALLLAITVGLATTLWQYRQALEQARIAREEARTAQAVQGFMEDIFKANSIDHPDPLKARQTTAEQLLDIAGKKMEGAMKDAPRSRLKMLNLLATLYDQLDLAPQLLAARKLAVDAASSPGMPVTDLLEALDNQITALFDRTFLNAFPPLAERQAELLKLHRIEDPLWQGAVEMNLSRAADTRSLKDEGRLRSEKAVALLRKAGSDRRLFDALVWRVGLRIYRGGEPAEAELDLKEAEGILNRHQGIGDWPDLLKQRLGLLEMSSYLKWSTDPIGAVAAARQAVALVQQASLPNDDQLRYFSRMVAVAQCVAGQPLAAVEELDARWHLAEGRGGDKVSSQQAMLLMRYGNAAWEAGRTETALRTADRLEQVGKQLKDDFNWAFELQFRIRGWLELGQVEAASAALAHAAQLYSEREQSRGPFAELYGLAIADLHLARGEWVQARQMSEALLANPQNWTDLGFKLEPTELAAAAAIGEGNLQEADRRIDESIRSIAAFVQPQTLAPHHAQLLWLQARSRLQRHDAAAALPSAASAVAMYERVVDAQQSLKLAGMLGTLARAQAATGQRAAALQSYKRMQAIHARHPGLGPSVRNDLRDVARVVGATAR